MSRAGATVALGALLLVVACQAPASGEAAEEDPPATPGRADAWGEVLTRHHRDGGLDYAGLAADRQALDDYLATVRAARLSEWSEAERLAFWMNAYNAVVADFVLRRYPEIDSVREVDGFFDAQTYPVAGEEMTLDEIETRARDSGDARVHFAVVCASTSCPDLRAEPYVAGRLDAQLAEQTAIFLAQPDKGLRYDPAENVLWLSSIFKWYAGDFTGGSTVVAFVMRGKVLEWVAEHVPAELRATLADRDPAVRYLDYDWSLNDRPAADPVLR